MYLHYILNAIIIYLLLAFVPSSPLSQHDNIFIAIIITLIYAIIEQLFTLYGLSSSTTNAYSCPSQCSIPKYEHMENTDKFDINKVMADVPIGSLLDNTKDVTQTAAQAAAQPAAQPVAQPVAQPATQVPEEQDKTLTHNMQRLPNGNYDIKPVIFTQAEADGSREKDGLINNEMGYTDYNGMPQYDKDAIGDFEYGYSFMPPSNWFPVPAHPPVCVSTQKCQVNPVFTSGVPVNIKEWNNSRRILPPDNINTEYIKKLNAGR